MGLSDVKTEILNYLVFGRILSYFILFLIYGLFVSLFVLPA